ncbi:leucine rich repeat protein, putative [Eimeria praecox]|uniref:Leucine rich repeat protein, putative n=1 Tax=Eimeria praecox TaxID=51316 RepID=U6H5R6_9EIME|nr:leucine rich repeat protein, putative [Eimeria praecox]
MTESGLYTRPDLNTKLYLHRRGFKKIENLDEYTEVQALWLGGNGIRRLENLHPLSKLKCLFLAQNGLTCIENLESCPDLVILDLSENSISRIQGLEKLKRLSSFKIARNKLTSLSDILALRECPSLTNVDISYNCLSLHDETGLADAPDPHEGSSLAPTTATLSIRTESKGTLEERHQLDKASTSQPIPNECHVNAESPKQNEDCADSAIASALPLCHAATAMGEQSANSRQHAQESRGFVECFNSLPGLATLYLLGNPVTKQITQYRRTLIANLPALRYLDDRPVKEEDREAALAWFRGGWEEEQKVIKAYKEREQEILRGHVSTLRRLQTQCLTPIKLSSKPLLPLTASEKIKNMMRTLAGACEQEAHRQKISLALERISREAAERQKAGMLTVPGLRMASNET